MKFRCGTFADSAFTKGLPTSAKLLDILYYLEMSLCAIILVLQMYEHKCLHTALIVRMILLNFSIFDSWVYINWLIVDSQVRQRK